MDVDIDGEDVPKANIDVASTHSFKKALRNDDYEQFKQYLEKNNILTTIHGRVFASNLNHTSTPRRYFEIFNKHVEDGFLEDSLAIKALGRTPALLRWWLNNYSDYVSEKAIRKAARGFFNHHKTKEVDVPNNLFDIICPLNPDGIVINCLNRHVRKRRVIVKQAIKALHDSRDYIKRKSAIKLIKSSVIKNKRDGSIDAKSIERLLDLGQDIPNPLIKAVNKQYNFSHNNITRHVL